jgi:universal stress protein A
VKRVLCAIDLSDASVALLKHAADIAQRYGGALTVLHVVPTFDAVETHPGEWFAPVTIVYLRREAVMERVRQAVLAAGIRDDDVRCEAEAGEPATVIVARALALRADTIVLGTHARHGLESLLGSTADAVLRRAPCDVLTVPPSYAPPKILGATIVCGVDFSAGSRRVVRAAFGLANQIHARVVLVHAIEWLVEVETPDQVDFNVSDFRTRLVYNAQHQLDALVGDEAAADRVVRTKVAIGRPYRELLRVAAEEHADLIVVGNGGGGGAALPMLGSTGEQIVRAAVCALLMIQSPPEQVGRTAKPHDLQSQSSRNSVREGVI